MDDYQSPPRQRRKRKYDLIDPFPLVAAPPIAQDVPPLSVPPPAAAAAAPAVSAPPKRRKCLEKRSSDDPVSNKRVARSSRHSSTKATKKKLSTDDNVRTPMFKVNARLEKPAFLRSVRRHAARSTTAAAAKKETNTSPRYKPLPFARAPSFIPLPHIPPQKRKKRTAKTDRSSPFSKPDIKKAFKIKPRPTNTKHVLEMVPERIPLVRDDQSSSETDYDQDNDEDSRQARDEIVSPTQQASFRFAPPLDQRLARPAQVRKQLNLRSKTVQTECYESSSQEEQHHSALAQNGRLALVREDDGLIEDLEDELMFWKTGGMVPFPPCSSSSSSSPAAPPRPVENAQPESSLHVNQAQETGHDHRPIIAVRRSKTDHAAPAALPLLKRKVTFSSPLVGRRAPPLATIKTKRAQTHAPQQQQQAPQSGIRARRRSFSFLSRVPSIVVKRRPIDVRARMDEPRVVVKRALSALPVPRPPRPPPAPFDASSHRRQNQPDNTLLESNELVSHQDESKRDVVEATARSDGSSSSSSCASSDTQVENESIPPCAQQCHESKDIMINDDASQCGWTSTCSGSGTNNDEPPNNQLAARADVSQVINKNQIIITDHTILAQGILSSLSL